MQVKNNLTIWQQNVNKSPTCQHDLVSSNELTSLNIDILALQEPAINSFNNTVASRDWVTVYPTTHKEAPGKTRSVLMIWASISMDTWHQLDFPSGDVTVIQMAGNWGKLTILNIYNDGNNNATINALTKYHQDNRNILEQVSQGKGHVVWMGDFNRHHPC
jgi:exonuclease III